MSENTSVNKLPPEVIGLILLKLGNSSERHLQEIKNCRLISHQWHEAVQVLFQDQFFQKGLTHFDGLKHAHEQSSSGLNVFGSFPLNFATFKISNSELFLMKNLLARLISTNLQNLILQDNQLNLKELLEVLKNFPNIVHLEFVQTSKNGDVANKMCQLYANPDDKSDIETIEMIKSEIGGNENCLRNLKSINFKIIHASVSHFIILVISCTACELEEISIDFNTYGIVVCINRCHETEAFADVLSKGYNENSPHEFFKNYTMRPFPNLNKLSKSLKKFKIVASFPEIYPKDPLCQLMKSQIEQMGVTRFFHSILSIFNENQMDDLKNIEQVEIYILKYQISQNGSAGLLDFLKSRNKLSKGDIAVIAESSGSNQHQSHEHQIQSKKSFLQSLSSLGVQFGCQVSKLGFDPIVQFSENLSILQIDIYDKMLMSWTSDMTPVSQWRFSDYEITFPNCKSLILINCSISGGFGNRWSDFEVPVIIQKFPNLKKLKFKDSHPFVDSQRPQISNEDLQNIIKSYSSLEKLSLDCCIHNLDDSGMTGLTSQALQVRKFSPNLPLTSGERPGLPISHLKKLVKLIICKSERCDQSQPRQITNLTPIYGFDYETPKLKYFSISQTNITDYGIEILKEKFPSKCQIFTSRN